LTQSDKDAVYRYYPDIAIDPACEGTFRVDKSSWDFSILESAEAEARVRVTTDIQCVSRLVQKLKAESHRGVLPEEIVWIA